jgi:hypothetical protein
MSLDIWFREDIKNIILAAEQANVQGLQSGLWSTDPELQRACPECKRRTYHQGFRAALSTLALAFGLAPLPLHDPEEEEYKIIQTEIASGRRLQLPLPERLSRRRSLFIVGEEEREELP